MAVPAAKRNSVAMQGLDFLVDAVGRKEVEDDEGRDLFSETNENDDSESEVVEEPSHLIDVEPSP